MQEMRIYETQLKRTLKLTEWTPLQSPKIATVVAHLKDKWAPGIIVSIQNQLGGVGKGWFNLHEKKRDVYQWSKLKRFLRVVTAMQQDSLRFMVEDSALEFTEFIEQACQGSVRIKGINDVSTEGTRRNPLYLCELGIDDVAGVSLVPTPEQFVAACLATFDEGLQLGTIYQAENTIMRHIFPHAKDILLGVDPNEELPLSMRNRVKDALERWIPEVNAYLDTYADYKVFLTSTVQSHLDALSTDETTLADIKKALVYHLQRVEDSRAEIPAAVSLGAFHINTQIIRTKMVEKHQQVADGIKQLVVTLAGVKCNEIFDQFKEMANELRKPAKSPEHAQELRGYFKDVEAQTAALQPMINELPAYYDFLDEFFFELADDDDLLRWNAFKGPIMMDEQIELATETCVAAENSFQDAMVAQQGAFGSEVMHMNNVVSAYNGKIDTENLQSIAADTKKFKLKLVELDEKAKTFNAHEGIFNLPQTDYSHIQKLTKEFEPFTKLWETASAFTTVSHPHLILIYFILASSSPH